MMKLAFLAALLVLPALCAAEMYTWEDKEGVHFTDNPESIPKKYRKKKSPVESREDIDGSPASRPRSGARSYRPERRQSYDYEEERARYQRENEQMEKKMAKQALERFSFERCVKEYVDHRRKIGLSAILAGEDARAYCTRAQEELTRRAK